MFQLDLNIIGPLIVWGCIYVFVTNYRSYRRMIKLYNGNIYSIKCIQRANVNIKGIVSLRQALGNLSIDDLKPEKYNLSLVEHWVKLTNEIGVKRVVTEQAAVVNYYLEIHCKDLDNFRFNRYPVEVFLKHINETLLTWQLNTDTKLSQIQRLHCVYLILMQLGKRFKLDATEVFVLRPLYAELFKGLSPISSGDIDRLATEALNRSSYGQYSACYSTAMGLKLIYFYLPAFNAYQHVKKLKSETNF